VSLQFTKHVSVVTIYAVNVSRIHVGVYSQASCIKMMIYVSTTKMMCLQPYTDVSTTQTFIAFPPEWQYVALSFI